MAMIRMEPTAVRVRTDWFDGRPREVTWGDERLPITAPGGRAPRSLGLPHRSRPADGVRGRDPQGSAGAELPASFATLDHRGPRRGTPRRLTDPAGARAGDPPNVVPGRTLAGRVRRYRARPAGESIVGSPGDGTRSAFRATLRPGARGHGGHAYNRQRGDDSTTVPGPHGRRVHRRSRLRRAGAGWRKRLRGGCGARRRARGHGCEPLGRRPRYAEHAATHDSAGARGRELADRFLTLADRDSDAYAGFAAALKMPRETDAEKLARTTALRAAARVAAEVPLACVEGCRELVVAAEMLAGRSNANAASDLSVASLLAEAAAEGAAANVLVNLPSVGDDDFSGEMTTRVEALLADVVSIARRTRAVVTSGEARGPLPANA